MAVVEEGGGGVNTDVKAGVVEEDEEEEDDDAGRAGLLLFLEEGLGAFVGGFADSTAASAVVPSPPPPAAATLAFFAAFRSARSLAFHARFFSILLVAGFAGVDAAVATAFDAVADEEEADGCDGCDCGGASLGSLFTVTGVVVEFDDPTTAGLTDFVVGGGDDAVDAAAAFDLIE